MRLDGSPDLPAFILIWCIIYQVSNKINKKRKIKFMIIQCLHCGKDNNNEKFCSRSCNLLYQNRLKNNKIYDGLCKHCNEKISNKWTSRKYCDACQEICNPNIVNWSKITVKQLRDKLKTFQFHARIRALARKNYQNNNKPKECKICGYKKYFEICHIKPISQFSTDTTIAQVNDINNLVALCRNCHWEFDHGLLTLK